MPLIARITATILTILGVLCLLAAIWTEDSLWQLILSAALFLFAALVVVAVTNPNAGKRK